MTKFFIVISKVFLFIWVIVATYNWYYVEKRYRNQVKYNTSLQELVLADGIYYDAAECLIDSFRNGNTNGAFCCTKYWKSAKNKVDSIYTKNGWNCDFE